jgi:beta-lactamase regulating signal transducer with metallopeptidase domain
MPWLSFLLSNVLLASLLGLAAYVVQYRLRWPTLARILWLLVLVKLVTPPMVDVQLGGLSGPVACRLGTCRCGNHAAAQSLLNQTIPLGLLAAWSLGALAVGWTAWRRWRRFQRLMACAVPARGEWQSLAARLSDELGLTKTPEILAVPGRLPPLVIAGRGQARMLLPRDLLDQLNSQQREALLLHELVHLRRGDHFVRLLELAVGVVYWWLPLVGSAGRQLRACEEFCCDAEVVTRLPQARRDYARLLLDVLDFADPPPLQVAPQASAMSVSNHLEQRLCAILETAPGTERRWPTAALAFGLALAVLPCQLEYDLSGLPSDAARRDVCQPPFSVGCESSAVRGDLVLKNYGCPI